MNRPKENKYACMSSGCLSEPTCHACETAKLWRYIRYLESKIPSGKEIHDNEYPGWADNSEDPDYICESCRCGLTEEYVGDQIKGILLCPRCKRN